MTLESVSNEVILELENRNDIFKEPIALSERIKYTSFTVSSKYIVFGANSGGLYIFKRSTNSFWQLVPSSESAVTLISISATENYIAFATIKHVVCILKLNDDTMIGKPLHRVTDLHETEITTIIWGDDHDKPTLFIGTSDGRVSFIEISSVVRDTNEIMYQLSLVELHTLFQHSFSC